MTGMSDIEAKLSELEDEADDEMSDAEAWRAFVEKHTNTSEDDEREAE